jgi:hypothetical protein
VKFETLKAFLEDFILFILSLKNGSYPIENFKTVKTRSL